jgi:hypothetical protein
MPGVMLPKMHGPKLGVLLPTENTWNLTGLIDPAASLSIEFLKQLDDLFLGKRLERVRCHRFLSLRPVVFCLR